MFKKKEKVKDQANKKITDIRTKLPPNVILKQVDLLDSEVEQLQEIDGKLTNSCLQLGFDTIQFFRKLRKADGDLQGLDDNFNAEVSRVLKRLKIKGKFKPPIDYDGKKMTIYTNKDPKEKTDG